MRRRQFIQTSSALAAGLAIGSLPQRLFAAGKAELMGPLGLQIYTVRNQIAKDPAAAFKAIQAAGYQQVEGGDVTLLDQLMPHVKDAGLTMKSSFFPWSTVTGRWDLLPPQMLRGEKPTYEQILEKANAHGLTHLVFGYLLPGERDTLDQFRELSDKLNKAGEQAKKAGIQLCYHNHSFEYLPMEGSTPFDVLIERLDADLVRFELDVFWASIGGWDPVKTMKRLKGRIELLHLKDKLAGTPVIYNEREVPENAYKELGTGVVDLETIIKLGQKQGVTHAFVEQDQSPDPLSSIKVSASYLKARGY